MPTKTKSRAANVPVPQSREEAAEALRQIGVNTRELSRLEADLNDEIAAAKARLVTAATAPNARLAQLKEGLRIWCEANRAALTDNGRTKTVDLGTGKVSWRLLPPKVTLVGVPAIIAALKAARLRAFVRIKEEVDKEAILGAAPKVRGRLVEIAGLTIGSAGEEFTAEPFETTIPAAPALQQEAA